MRERIAARRTEGERAVLCRRLRVSRQISDHLDCPYCFGREADVRGGDWKRFCDFDPKHDPICFGFPTGFGHLARG